MCPRDSPLNPGTKHIIKMMACNSKEMERGRKGRGGVIKNKR